MMVPEEKVADIRDRTDIVALIGEHIRLKRSGASFKGLCPFHGEKSPSFYVHPDRGFYHCFGCQSSGDVISFLMRLEALSFPEALRVLAERAGIELTEDDGVDDSVARQARARRERQLSIMDSAAGFFVRMLSEHDQAHLAREALEGREIDQPTTERFRLGYAPAAWDELSTYLAQLGFSPADCETVGLIVSRKSGSGHYDRFRHRLMFPISDKRGRIVAFSGRALAPPAGEERASDDAPAKYINSPETPLYKKGELLFGLHEARVELRKRNFSLVCEGNFDVVALSQAGFPNVVAPLGTAFTADQAQLLKRYCAKAILVFDADRAGQKAVAAAQPLLAKADMAAAVITLPEGQDPDSYLRSKGAESMGRLVSSAPSIVDHLIEVRALASLGDPRAQAEAIESLGPVIASLDNPVEARLYVERVANAFEIRDLRAVRDQLRRGLRRGEQSGRRRRGEPEKSPTPPRDKPKRKVVELSEMETALVGAFLDQPSLTSGHAEKVNELLTSDDLRAIFALTARWASDRGVNAAALLAEIGDSPARQWLERRLVVQDFQDKASAESFIERVMSKLVRDRVKRENKRLKQEFLQAKRAGDDELAEALMRRMNELFQTAAGMGPKGTEG